ncbi:hypothetical protein [Ascidiimonas sp. W6]|uniref:hypothetical protein n=1 Tax=Ascidiimonas meishanensis TaxID=3128903 RepID=UPI0030EB8B0A
MFFRKRYSCLLSTEHNEPIEVILSEYFQEASKDIQLLHKFLLATSGQDLLLKESISSITNILIDEYDLGLTCNIARNGCLKISLGLILAIDGFSNLQSSSYLDDSTYVNNKSFEYFGERFPVFSDYNFINFIEKINVNLLFALTPCLPKSEEFIEYWSLTGSLIFSYFIFHELGHQNLGHFKVVDESTKPLKIFEYEADSYALIRLFQEYFREDFHLDLIRKFHHPKNIQTKYLLHNVLSSSAFSALSIIAGLTQSDSNSQIENEAYPSTESRILNMITTFHSVRFACNSLNDISKKEICLRINEYELTTLLFLAIIHSDKTMVSAKRLPILNNRFKMSFVIDPSGRRFIHYEMNESVDFIEVKKRSRSIIINFWLWYNQTFVHSSNKKYEKPFEEWQSIIQEGKSKRGSYWDVNEAVTFESMFQDPIRIIVCKFYKLMIKNHHELLTGVITKDKLLSEAISLVDKCLFQEK